MKVKQINKVKVRIFEENELKEKLCMGQSDIDLILEYQEIFPELLQDDIEGFIIDARKLHSQLKLQQDFSHWIKNQIKNLDLEKDKSYTSSKTNCTTMRPNASIEYYLTLDCAKDICMTVGSSNRTNKETKDISKMVRNYFKLMEKTLRNYEKWITIRNPEKENAKLMKLKIADWCDTNGYDKTLDVFYTREFNLLNESLTGLKAQGIKSYLNYKDIQTREHLNSDINSALDYLQKLNISLLDANISFEERSKIIKITCDNQYSHLKIN